jgi:hypothetical protein
VWLEIWAASLAANVPFHHECEVQSSAVSVISGEEIPRVIDIDVIIRSNSPIAFRSDFITGGFILIMA